MWKKRRKWRVESGDEESADADEFESCECALSPLSTLHVPLLSFDNVDLHPLYCFWKGRDVMSRQMIFGIFLLLIGVIGLIVGLVTGHFADSPGQTALYILPVALGIIMLVLDRTSR